MAGYLFLALAVGFVLPLQAGINAQLRTGLGHPLLAALASFLVGTIALAGAALIGRLSLPSAGALAAIPGWQWTGGLLGAVYILLAVILAPKLGAATLIATVVGGQMLASLVLDHYGAAGYAQHPVNVMRVLGALLVIGGVILIQRN
jgi:transporter family-2 protein